MTLSLYIARRFFWMFVRVLAVFFGILMLIDMLDQLRRLSGRGVGLVQALELSVLNVPESLYNILPLIMILSAVAMFLGFARSSELVVVRAAGRSGLRFLLAPVTVSLTLGVLAVAVLILFSQIGLQNGMVKLIIAHTAFCIPFAFLPIRARLQGMEPDFEEAAQDLYATPWVAFRRVTLPLIAPGVFAGAMLAFVISMDDFITSNMLNSGGSTTLPVYIFGLIKQGTTPELNAISTLIVLGSLVLATTALILTFRTPSRG